MHHLCRRYVRPVSRSDPDRFDRAGLSRDLRERFAAHIPDTHEARRPHERVFLRLELLALALSVHMATPQHLDWSVRRRSAARRQAHPATAADAGGRAIPECRATTRSRGPRESAKRERHWSLPKLPE